MLRRVKSTIFQRAKPKLLFILSSPIMRIPMKLKMTTTEKTLGIIKVYHQQVFVVLN